MTIFLVIGISLRTIFLEEKVTNILFLDVSANVEVNPFLYQVSTIISFHLLKLEDIR